MKFEEWIVRESPSTIPNLSDVASGFCQSGSNARIDLFERD